MVRGEAKRHDGEELVLFITTCCQGYKQEFHTIALIPPNLSRPQPPPTSEDSAHRHCHNGDPSRQPLGDMLKADPNYSNMHDRNLHPNKETKE